tara:strand:- start:3361 stop:4086 length:726 start_codon:yes stop_codon:yes gene_type:complete
MKTISYIVSAFKTASVNKFELIMTREEKALSKAFINICHEVYELIESNIKEDQGLGEYRKEWNEAFINLGLKNSSYTFANMLKIGKVFEKDSLWLFGFKNLTCLAIGLAGLQSVPACNGIASLEIVATNDPKQSISDRIKEIPNNLESKELRAKVNDLKGMPAKLEKVKEALPIESKPVHNTLEESALSMAKALIVNINQDNAYLLAFVTNIVNLNSDYAKKLEDTLFYANKNKRVDLTIK